MYNISEYIHKEDTIAAISTPSGAGGIGVVRISGPKSWEIGRRIYRKRSGKALGEKEIIANQLKLGFIVNPRGNEKIDQALCVFFKGPASYTGQDCMEIQGHGGAEVLEKILDLVKEQGARQAGPGEYTYRAFRNGKIDLGQAEAVAELIQAGTRIQSMMALDNLRSGVSGRIQEIRSQLLELAATLDAAIDFPDEMDEIINHEVSRGIRENVCGQLERLIRKSEENRIFARGAKVVVCGRPNVGKSSLFNKLLGRNRALVYEKAGTTRDSLEEAIDLAGVACRLIDTAGIGQAGEEIEEMGMGISRERVETADLCLVVLDGSEKIKEEDLGILENTAEKPRIIALNKADKEKTWKMPPEIANERIVLAISAKTGQGIDNLIQKLREMLTKGKAEPMPGQASVNQRQALLLKKCLKSCRAGLDAIDSGEGKIEIASLEIGQALQYLGEVDGKYAPDEVLEEIFSKFCVGK